MEKQKSAWGKSLFLFGGLACLSPWVSSAVALLGGAVLALAIGNPFSEKTRTWTSSLLSLSVIGLGAGMNLEVVAKVGLKGVSYTIIGISSTLLLGFMLAKILKIDRNTGFLISVGTAICGGSAIAAVAPVIRAKPHQVSVALGIVFLLNSLALFIFPFVGQVLHLTQEQFGLWSALAIHDTSSVVGATLQYGAQALEVGTTVKLARALWIVPITFLMSYLHRDLSKTGQESSVKAKRPWFILGFLIAAALVTWVPQTRPVGNAIYGFAQRGLVLTLFLIGGNLSRATLKEVGLRPFLQGIFLWVIVATSVLGSILLEWIQ